MNSSSEPLVYSSAPALRSPRRFVAATAADMRLVPALAWRIFKRGVQARHRQAGLGYAWLLAPPVATTLVWVYLNAAGVIHVGNSRIPYLVYVLSGTMLWQIFLDALLGPMRQLNSARNVLDKAKLPHEAWVVAGIVDVLFGFVVRLMLLIAVLLLAGTSLHWTILLIPLAVFALLLLGVSVGLLVTPVGLLFEDVGHGVAVVATFLFFLTPVIYQSPPHQIAAVLVRFNPVTPVLTTGRAWLTGAPGGSVEGLLLVLGGASGLLLVAWLAYRVAQPHLVARI